jgi:septum formation topological specificity factor MinE
MSERRIKMGKISINLECNSIEEAKALLDFLATYRKEQKKEKTDTVDAEDRKVTAEEVNRLTKDVLKDVSKTVEVRAANMDTTVRDGVPDEVKDRITAEVISRFAVSLLRQGKGAEIKRLLAAYNAKAFTDLPQDKMAVFLKTLQRL